VSLREERLRQDAAGLRRYRNAAVRIRAMHGSPPEAYEITYLCAGVVDEGFKKRYQHVVDVRFPANYPYQPPHFVFRDGLFHPNVWARGLVCLGDERLWRPTYLAQHLIAYVGRLIEFQAYNAEDPAGNGLVVAGWQRWIARHEEALPLARTNFEDLSGQITGRINIRRPSGQAEPTEVETVAEPQPAGNVGLIRVRRRAGGESPSSDDKPTGVRLRRRS